MNQVSRISNGFEFRLTLPEPQRAASRSSRNGGCAGGRTAVRVSGEDLTSFFTAWLRTPSRPALTADNGLA